MGRRKNLKVRPASRKTAARSHRSSAGVLAVVGRMPAWSQPTALAVVLALLAWPFVAVTLVSMTLGQAALDGNGNPALNGPPLLPANSLAQWSGTGGAVFLSALVAGTLGGPMVRRNWLAGCALTFVVALIVAIPTVPLLPAILGQHVGFGCTSIFFGGAACGYAVATNDLAGGVISDAFFWLAPIAAPGPVLILALGVTAWAALLRRLSQVDAQDQDSTIRQKSESGERIE
jgi:hypothetical protein